MFDQCIQQQSDTEGTNISEIQSIYDVDVQSNSEKICLWTLILWRIIWNKIVTSSPCTWSLSNKDLCVYGRRLREVLWQTSKIIHPQESAHRRKTNNLLVGGVLKNIPRALHLPASHEISHWWASLCLRDLPKDILHERSSSWSWETPQGW